MVDFQHTTGSFVHFNSQSSNTFVGNLTPNRPSYVSLARRSMNALFHNNVRLYQGTVPANNAGPASGAFPGPDNAFHLFRGIERLKAAMRLNETARMNRIAAAHWQWLEDRRGGVRQNFDLTNFM